MLIWEQIIKKRIRVQRTISEKQFGLMPEKSTIKPLFCVRQLVEKLQEKYYAWYKSRKGI